LCLEIGEAAIIGGTARVASRLRELRELGREDRVRRLRSGYSRYLRCSASDRHDQAPQGVRVGLLIRRSRTTRAILLATVAAARELGMSVIACGVEDPCQLEALRAAGCDCAQGNGIAPPRKSDNRAPRKLAA